MKRGRKILLRALAAILLFPVAILVTLAVLAHLLYPWPAPVPGANIEPLRPPKPASSIRPESPQGRLGELRAIASSKDTKGWEDEYERFREIGCDESAFPSLRERFRQTDSNVQIVCQFARVSPQNDWVGPQTRSVLFSTDRLLCFRAESAACEGRWDESATDIAGICRSARCVTGGATLFAGTVTDMLFPVVRRISLDRPPPEAWAQQVDAELEGLEEGLSPHAWAEAIRLRRLTLHAFADVARGKSWRLYYAGCMCGIVGEMTDRYTEAYFQACEAEEKPSVRLRVVRWCYDLYGCGPAKTKRHLDAAMSHLVSLQDADCEAAATAMRQFERPDNELGALLYGLNDPVGRMLLKSLSTASHEWPKTGGIGTRLRALADLRVTRLVVAIRCYQGQHVGALPAQLEDLVPMFLQRLPDDPLAAAPGTTFGYRATTSAAFTVWSTARGQMEFRFTSDELEKRRVAYRKREAEAKSKPFPLQGMLK